MVSAGFAPASRGSSALPQSQAQYLKEAFGVPLGPPPSTNPATTTEEWPSLSAAAGRNEFPPGLLKNPAYGAEFAAQHRALAHSNSLGRMTPNNPLICRRSTPMTPRGMETPRPLGTPQQFLGSPSSQPNGMANGAPKNPKLYKTELCRSWMDSGRCNYGERCQYAHGEAEKRPIHRHPKYKTEACQSYHQSGYCAYGPRCHFVHNEDPALLAQLVASNAASGGKPSGGASPPLRPANLLAGGRSAVGGRPNCATPTGPPQMGIAPASNNSAISAAAALAAAAFNQQPHLFSRQFQTQLQIFNDGMKNSQPPPPTTANVQTGGGSTGESPIPSSNDSGTESPICSFSPGSELEDPLAFVRRQLEAAKSMPKSQADFMAALSAARPPLARGSAPTTPGGESLPLGSSGESGFLSSASSCNGGTKPLNSPVVGSPPQSAAPTTWSPIVGTPTGAARLPVFERLSNGP